MLNRMQPAFWLMAVALFVLFSADSADADIKQLVMPGKVVQAHAQYESQCERCHQPFQKKSQKQLCLDCHKPLAEDLKRKMGFHGRSAAVAAVECKHCHTDHRGRDADILQLDPETFDHQIADFRLEGAHLQQACDKCHKPVEGEAQELAADAPAPAGFYSRTKSACIACHAKTEPHQKRLGDQCQKCHQAKSWREVRYRHDKTPFRINLAHKIVTCSLCHPNQRWKKIASDCFSCHRLDDAHAGRYGKKCQDCHTDNRPPKDPKKPKSAWNQVRYDHNKTKFALDGKHEKAACDLCHPGKLYGQKLKTDCLSCHQKDDRHKGFYGPKCNDCHSTKGWQLSSFDHQKTKFPLRDKHVKVACSSCHTRPTSGEKLGSACVNCHQLEDVHRDKETSRCERCHTPAGWRESASFEHDLTRFPLLGLHAAAPCESCHQSSEFRQVKKECNECHAKDDKHKQSLGTACDDCHNPNGWKLWQYDHNAGTKSFKLEGAHLGLECRACHKKPVNKKIKLDRTCAACHRETDIHRGEFGRNCERCHLSESFKKLRINR